MKCPVVAYAGETAVLFGDRVLIGPHTVIRNFAEACRRVVFCRRRCGVRRQRRVLRHCRQVEGKGIRFRPVVEFFCHFQFGRGELHERRPQGGLCGAVGIRIPAQRRSADAVAGGIRGNRKHNTLARRRIAGPTERRRICPAKKCVGTYSEHRGGVAAFDRHARELFAVLERRFAHARHARWDRHAFELTAVAERKVPDARHTRRDRHAFEAFAVSERTGPDGLHA